MLVPVEDQVVDRVVDRAAGQDQDVDRTGQEHPFALRAGLAVQHGPEGWIRADSNRFVVEDGSTGKARRRRLDNRVRRKLTSRLTQIGTA